MNVLDTVCEKIKNEPGFAGDLADAPEATLAKHNLSVSNEVLETMKGMDEAGLREIGASYDSDKAAC